MTIYIWLCGGSVQQKNGSRHLPATWRRAQHRDNDSFPSSPHLKLHNSFFLCMSLAPPSCCPSTESHSECLGVRESVYGPFKKAGGFPATFLLTQMDVIPADFHCQMLWGLLFPALVLQTWEPSVGLGPLTV